MATLTKKQLVFIPPPVWEVFRTFTEAGYEIFLVGGGVRNLLQEKTPIDCDFTTNARPEIIQSFYDDSFYDNKFGTVGIPVTTPQGEEVYEITTYRSEEGYSDRRRPDQIKWETKLEKDLERREFTLNAMVVGPVLSRGRWDGQTLEMIDLFGGQKDYRRKIIRAVGNPRQRFGEDALRMMRAVRFAAQLGFTIEPKTFAAIRKQAPLIRRISAERVKASVAAPSEPGKDSTTVPPMTPPVARLRMLPVPSSWYVNWRKSSPKPSSFFSSIGSTVSTVTSR